MWQIRPAPLVMLRPGLCAARAACTLDTTKQLAVMQHTYIHTHVRGCIHVRARLLAHARHAPLRDTPIFGSSLLFRRCAHRIGWLTLLHAHQSPTVRSFSCGRPHNREGNLPGLRLSAPKRETPRTKTRPAGQGPLHFAMFALAKMAG